MIYCGVGLTGDLHIVDRINSCNVFMCVLKNECGKYVVNRVAGMVGGRSGVNLFFLGVGLFDLGYVTRGNSRRGIFYDHRFLKSLSLDLCLFSFVVTIFTDVDYNEYYWFGLQRFDWCWNFT